MVEFGPEPVYEPEGGYGEGDHPDECILNTLNHKKGDLIMARKKEVKEEKAFQGDSGQDEKEKPFDASETGQDQGGVFLPNSDFDLEDEYKPEPLLPSGNYRGNVIGVVFDAEKNAIVWKVALDENGGLMSDGETPVDGSHHYYRNWLPKPGDEKEPTKDGRSNKRQSKINMMKQFADAMKISMNSPTVIAESISNQDWVGIQVMTTISISEYMGVTRNQIDRMAIIEE